MIDNKTVRRKSVVKIVHKLNKIFILLLTLNGEFSDKFRSPSVRSIRHCRDECGWRVETAVVDNEMGQ